MAKKKTAKKTVKKAAKKISKKTVKKVPQKRTVKKAAKKTRSSSASGHPSFQPSLQKDSSFPRDSLEHYGIAKNEETSFTGARLAVLAVLGGVVLLLSAWGVFTGDGEKIPNSPDPLTEPDITEAPLVEEIQEEEVETEPSAAQEQQLKTPPLTGANSAGNSTANPVRKPAGNSTANPAQQKVTPKKSPQADPYSGTAPKTKPTAPNSPPPIPVPSNPNTYTVQAGDTVTSIARKTLGKGARYQEIMDLNGLSSPNELRPGQVLNIPPK